MRESKEGSRRNMAGVLNEMLSKAELVSLLRQGVRKETILSWVDWNEQEGVLGICLPWWNSWTSQLKGKRISSTHSSRSQSSMVGKFQTQELERTGQEQKMIDECRHAGTQMVLSTFPFQTVCDAQNGPQPQLRQVLLPQIMFSGYSQRLALLGNTSQVC